jgi:hypothetical protein
LKNLVRFYGKLHVQLPLDNDHDGYVLEPLTVDLHCLLALVSPDHDPKQKPAKDLRLDLKAKRAGLPIEAVKRFIKGIIEGLGFLHEELGLLYAGKSSLFMFNQHSRDRDLMSCSFGYRRRSSSQV